jgi:hypothetical protein
MHSIQKSRQVALPPEISELFTTNLTKWHVLFFP